ncbi:MAG: ATP-grasp domain-containing protein [Sphaerospermopsis sp. SIO1G2]|nr:ATP-grasp domain-containing protein [Sphaerospermopsis sp. SIO1G2]
MALTAVETDPPSLILLDIRMPVISGILMSNKIKDGGSVSTAAAEIFAIAHKILNSLEVIGTFGIELFITADGKILINEIAPRTHNSGHFSIDACVTSQFEQHLRAVAGLPLADTSLTVPSAVMVNLLGYENSQSDYQTKRQQLSAIPHTYVHWYGKTESRPGRKLGHVTILLEQPHSDLESVIQAIESIWYPD